MISLYFSLNCVVDLEIKLFYLFPVLFRFPPPHKDFCFIVFKFVLLLQWFEFNMFLCL